MAADLVEDRGNDFYVFEMENITLTPPFPEPGKGLRWEMNGRLKAQVDLAQEQCQIHVKPGLVTTHIEAGEIRRPGTGRSSTKAAMRGASYQAPSATPIVASGSSQILVRVSL
ncbi:hypothetical protein OG413_27950 [Streptomyces sp. NBC_01433]|uniref:hypothetical protein n=1 Tax=Streptomyces sp. NBC_01433 TaxID=2903864 RepID=UPI00225A7EF9|nr:hypothetical protein [Streptomyces sp. NBC_01433]MCX4679092.1 hypothetical protein [Streptomyces sp. NBC_01433]